MKTKILKFLELQLNQLLSEKRNLSNIFTSEGLEKLEEEIKSISRLIDNVINEFPKDVFSNSFEEHMNELTIIEGFEKIYLDPSSEPWFNAQKELLSLNVGNYDQKRKADFKESLKLLDEKRELASSRSILENKELDVPPGTQAIIESVINTSESGMNYKRVELFIGCTITIEAISNNYVNSYYVSHGSEHFHVHRNDLQIISNI